MKKHSLKITSILIITCFLLQSIVLAWGGTYPEHPEYSSLKEQTTLAKYSNTPSDENYIFEIEGKKFILLDTDEDGNFFVLADDLYGGKAFDTSYSKSQFVIESATENADGSMTYTAGDVADFDESKVIFSTTDETNIGFWLNNGFLTSGNGGKKLPASVIEHLIEKDWAVEGMNGAVLGWQAKQRYDDLKGETTGADFAKKQVIEPYTVRGKISLMSLTEFQQYKDIIGLVHSNAIWKGMALRTPMSQLGGENTTSAVTSGKKIPKKLIYTWGTGLVRNSTADSSGSMLLVYNSAGHSSDMFVRPCFWLSKDFFKNVKVEVKSLGSIPKAEVKKNTNEELSAIGYTVADIMVLEGKEMSWDWGHYPSHATASTAIGESKTVSDGIVGESPAENLFTIGGRRFILLDRNIDGEYFVMADEEYGTGNMMSKAREGELNAEKGSNKNWDISDWIYNPTLENQLAWVLTNKNWGILSGKLECAFGYESTYTGDKTPKLIPQEMVDDILLTDWEIEPLSPIKGWKYNSYANEASKKEGDAWLARMAEQAKTEKVSAYVALMSAKEYDTYKSKIGFSNYVTGAVYAQNTLRTTGAQLSGNESTGEWSVNTGHMQVGLSTNQQSVTYSVAGPTDNKFMIRPVMWLAKDFFKNNKIDVKTAGDTVFAEMRDLYTAEDLSETYTEDEILVIKGIDKVAVLDFCLTDDTGEELLSGAANSNDSKVYLNTYIDNVTGATANIRLAIARYSNNKLAEVVQKSFEIEAGEVLEVGKGLGNELSVKVDDALDTVYKLFIWDSNNMIPYKDSKIYYSGNMVETLYNNKVYDFSVQPAIEVDSEVYVPVTELARTVGYTAEFSGDTLTVKGDGKTVELKADTAEISVNGEAVEISQAPIKRFDDLMVTVETLTSILPVDEDVTKNPDGIALHKEYYSDDTTFFNLNTTFSGSPKTERGFSWQAMPEYNDMVIEYSEGSSLSNATQVQAEYTSCPVVYNYDIVYATEEEISFYDNMLFYQIGLKNLKPGTTYSYRIGDKTKNEWSSVYNFTTEAENTDEFSIITVTDSQAYSENTFSYYKKTLDAAKADCPDAAFLTHLGDITENGTCDDWWNMHFKSSADMCESLPTVAVFGNHEARGVGSKYFNLHYLNPSNGYGLAENFDYSKANKYEKDVIKNLDNTVYSFDYGDVHFAVLNSGHDWGTEDLVTDLQKEWLKADMAKSDKKWKVVMLHIAIYRNTDTGNSTHSLYSLMDECDIDFVMQGHDHIVLRTKPMKKDVPYENDTPNVISHENGTVYALMGMSGYSGSGAAADHDYIEVIKPITKGNPNYNIVTFDSEKISVETKTIDGTVMDEFVITK